MPVGVVNRPPVAEPASPDDVTDSGAATPEELAEPEDEDDDAPLAALIARPRDATRGAARTDLQSVLRP